MVYAEFQYITTSIYPNLSKSMYSTFFVQNQLEQPCPIITQIAAGKTPAAMCSYLNPGCKITAINGQPVKGLSFHEVVTKLQKAKASVVLSVEEPISFLNEENHLHNRDSCCTWPVEAENGCLRKSPSEAQIRYANSFLADELQSIDLTCQCEQEQGRSPDVSDTKPYRPSPPVGDIGYMNGESSYSGYGIEEQSTSPSANDAKHTLKSVYAGSLPSLLYQDRGYMNRPTSNLRYHGIQETDSPTSVKFPGPHRAPSTCMCQQHVQGTGPKVNDAKHTLKSVYAGSMPSLHNYQDMGYMNGAGSNLSCHRMQESDSPLLPPKPHETPANQDMPCCQNCFSTTIPNKREQTIDHLPGRIYYWICLKLDCVTPFFKHDYRIFGEKLGFVRPEISLLRNSDQPTDHLLNAWVARKGKGATVGVLMAVFDETERHDLLELLKTWTENCTKCFEYQQENVRESDI